MTGPVTYLMDVGQGAANVILVGPGRAILVDGGPESRLPSRLLHQLGVRTLEMVVVASNDRDHAHAFAGILVEYWDRFKSVVFLQDRPVQDIGWLATLNKARGRRLRDAMGSGRFRRLETSDKRQPLWAEGDLRLELLHPRFQDNISAQADRRPNATSGVVVLSCPAGAIVFTGDAPVDEWRKIHALHGGIVCDVATAPHHGGVVAEHAEDAALSWLYTEALRAKTVLFSVGSGNTYGHPRSAHFRALRSAGRQAMCTQITDQCAPTSIVAPPGMLVRAHYEDPPSRSGSRHSRPGMRGCAGTVVVRMESAVVIERLSSHVSAVDLLALRHAPPLCRRP